MIPVVFINCSRYPFLSRIMYRTKRYETRTRNMLRALIGQRVILAETGRRGRPVARCMATINEPIVARSRSEWNLYRVAAGIEPDSQYDWQNSTKAKYLYPLTDVEPLHPFPVPEGVRHGRVWMEYEP